jgi:hypothetical protein
MRPRLKDKWPAGGECATSWTRANVTTPSYRIFSPPTDAGFDFSPYSLVVGFGDSLIEGLFRHKDTRDKQLYRPDTTSYKRNPMSELNNRTVGKLLKTLREWHGRQLSQSNVALVTGSAVWDLVSTGTVDPDFASHLEAVRYYVTQVRLEFPNVSVYWKSPSAVQPHMERDKYMSNSRERVLYEKQKIIMAELDIPFLDLWETYFLSGDHMLAKRNDGKHYSSELNILMQRWFYRGD